MSAPSPPTRSQSTRAASPLTAPQALLFDLGGVVIDIDFERVFRAWQPRSRLSLTELRTRFSMDVPYQRFERGEIEAAQYYAHLASVLELDQDHDFIAAGWNALFRGEIGATVHAIRDTTLPCYALTNTNAVHKTVWSSLFPEVVNAFERIFTSHEMGFRKPEQRAFDHVSAAMGVPKSAILFFDDLLENVEGARRAGLQAVHVRSPFDVVPRLAAIRSGA